MGGVMMMMPTMMMPTMMMPTMMMPTMMMPMMMMPTMMMPMMMMPTMMMPMMMMPTLSFPCADDGQTIFPNVTTSLSGEFSINGFSVTGGVEGKWLAFSFTGSVVPAGYRHLTTLEIDVPLSLCNTKPFLLTKGIVSDKKASTRCGGGGGGGGGEEQARSE